MVHLLENSSNATAPTTPLTGQLWWDTAGNLKVYTGSAFKTLGTTTSSASAPTGAVMGNAWWDTANQQLNLYNGSAWTLIGPAFTSNAGTSGTIVGTILDANAASHVAVNVYVSNTLVAIVSKDSTYTPQTSITGFTTIKPGFNLVSTGTVAGVAYWGTASDASGLGNVAAANYARTDTAVTFNSTVAVNNNTGLTIGTSNNFTTGVSGNIVQLTNNINNANIAIRANVGGSLTTALLVDGSTGNVSVPGTISGTGISLTGNVASVGHTGTSAQFTGNISASYLIGTAIQAQYADLAERFEADAAYDAGTVLQMGGTAEVTKAIDELSENVFGVVSTRAAYLMNSAAGDDATHPQVAISGRVPVKVIGKIKKGDRLVSAGNGFARAGAKSELTSFNVIGRALADKYDDAQGTIYAIVKLNS